MGLQPKPAQVARCVRPEATRDTTWRQACAKRRNVDKLRRTFLDLSLSDNCGRILTAMSIAQSTKKKDAGRIPGAWDGIHAVEIKMIFALPNTKPMISTIHGSYITAPANMQTLANALMASLSSAWVTRLATNMHPQTVFQQVQARDMFSRTNPVAFSTGAATPGTGTGAAMPESNAIVMTENIAARGRGLKGRIYLGGWVQSADVTTGGISGAVQTAINNMGTDWISALQAQSLTPCVAQPPRAAYLGYTGTSHPARGAGIIAVTSYVCRDLIWDTQRRRVQL